MLVASTDDDSADEGEDAADEVVGAGAEDDKLEAGVIDASPDVVVGVDRPPSRTTS
jgi:hypothetical protein